MPLSKCNCIAQQGGLFTRELAERFLAPHVRQAYGPEPAQRVDLYRERKTAHGTSTVRPVLIHLHGGRFVSGSKSRESLAMLNHLAAHGRLCLSADYRLRGDGQHPNPLVDIKKLIAWTRANSDELGADPSQVFLAGCSAGGHLAVSTALTPNAAEFQSGFEAAQTSVAGVIVWHGYLGPRTSAPSSSPASLARPDAPPRHSSTGPCSAD